MLVTLAVGAYLVLRGMQNVLSPLISTSQHLIYLFFGVCVVFGIMMTLPIGGADMPVVISIYNACTGLAVGLEGFVLQNPALMIAGMVVGAAGTLLTLLMAKSMNRSVGNVLFTDFGTVAKGKQGDMKGSREGQSQPPMPASSCATPKQFVIVVPGYGLAEAQAQQKLYEFVKLLQAAKVKVKIRDSSGGRTHARSDGRAAGRSRRTLRSDFPARRHQRRFRQHRRSSHHWRKRRSESCCTHRQSFTDLRHADLERRQSQASLRHKAWSRQWGMPESKTNSFLTPTAKWSTATPQAVLIKMIEAVRGLGAAAAA
jgi:hypothetical protein